jgi:hypothetical protein
MPESPDDNFAPPFQEVAGSSDARCLSLQDVHAGQTSSLELYR